jgi:AraC-like DNA-binding protein
MDFKEYDGTRRIFSGPRFDMYVVRGEFDATTEFEYVSDRLAIFACFQGGLISGTQSLDYRLEKNLLSFAMKSNCKKLVKAGTRLELVFLEFHRGVLDDAISRCEVDYQMYQQRFTSCACTVSNCSKEFLDLARRMFSESEQQNIGYKILMEALFDSMLVQFLRIFAKAGEEGDKPTNDIVESMKSFMMENMETGMSVDAMVTHIGYSRSHISRLFRQATGCTMIQYLNQMKVKQACEQLRNSDSSIEKISEKVGFENLNYFYRVFKMVTGMKPGEFRNSLMV